MHSSYNNQNQSKKSVVLIVLAIIVVIIIVLTLFALAISPKEKVAIANVSPSVFATEEATPYRSPTVAPTVEPSPTASPLPTPSPVPINLTSTYKKGDSGDDVLLIQNMLVDLGFDPVTSDGTYGNALKSAIKNFQLYEDLDADGIAGPATISALVASWESLYSVKPADNQVLKGIVIGLDAGHQQHSNSTLEKISPSGTKTKKKVSSGTTGTTTGVAEYIVNLQVAIRLKIELEALGATVIMARETHTVDISNAQRATMMNEAHVDCWLRIHANGSTDKTKFGMFMLIPADGCLDTKDERVYEKSILIARALLNGAHDTTGAKKLGKIPRSDLTGFCWSNVPVCLIEMGHMTNKDEDLLLVSYDYQKKIVDGLVDGFVEYFTGE